MLEHLTGRYPVGIYYLSENLWNPDGVRKLAEIGVDFLVAVRPNTQLLDLCQKNRIGILSSGNFQMWWGGDGSNAGHYADTFPMQTIERVRSTYPASPAIWGDYLVDEPNVQDYAHINNVIQYYRLFLPNKLPFVNLYPNYASVAGNTADQTVSQLGVNHYSVYIERYLQMIDLPYLCLDFYPLTGEEGGPFDRYFENLDIVSNACRRSGKSLWMITQAGAWKAEEAIDTFQLRWQTGLCLAYGARAIMHASYSKGWWEASTACVTETGEKNPMYDSVQKVNREIHAVGSDYLKYKNTGTYVCGDLSNTHPRIRTQLEQLPSRQSDVVIRRTCSISCDAALIAGTFENKASKRAVLLVNTQNPFDASATANVCLKTSSSMVILHHGEHCELLAVPKDGLNLQIASGDWLFLEMI